MFTYFINYINKSLARVLVFGMFLQFCSPALMFAGEGDKQPEATTFEPINTNQMVNKYNGNYTYNKSLFTVAGPNGGWPLNIFYHAGINQEMEASWVGLGWNLNPGSINRFVSGYPDDYFDGKAFSSVVSGITEDYSYSIFLGYGVGPASIGLKYDSNQGIGFGVDAGLYSVSAYKGYADIGINYAGASINYNTNNNLSVGYMGFDYSITDKKLSFGTSIGPVSLTNNGISSVGIGPVSYTMNNGAFGNTQYSSSGFNIKIPIYAFTIGLSFQKQKTWFNDNYDNNIFGLLYQAAFFNSDDNQSNESPESIWGNGAIYTGNEVTQSRSSQTERGRARWFKDTKVENWKYSDGVILNSSDKYIVNAHGVTGSFSPHFRYGYRLYDEEQSRGSARDKSGRFEWENVNNKNINSNGDINIQFRFDHESGGNLFSESIYRTGFSNEKWDNQSKSKILPVINSETGEIEGFQITQPDGSIYKFEQPVKMHHSLNKTISGYNKGEADEIVKLGSLESSYATTWMLTSVIGTDYVDRGVAGPSSDDWGYWVNFTYESSLENKSIPYNMTRTPYFGYSIDNINKHYFSMGFKDNVYLKHIETSTHLANFVTNVDLDNERMQENRLDNLPPVIHEDFLFNGYGEKGDYDQSIGRHRYGDRIYFPHSKSKLQSLIEPDIYSTNSSHTMHISYDKLSPSGGEWFTTTITDSNIKFDVIYHDSIKNRSYYEVAGAEIIRGSIELKANDIYPHGTFDSSYTQLQSGHGDTIIVDFSGTVFPGNTENVFIDVEVSFDPDLGVNDDEYFARVPINYSDINELGNNRYSFKLDRITGYKLRHGAELFAITDISMKSVHNNNDDFKYSRKLDAIDHYKKIVSTSGVTDYNLTIQPENKIESIEFRYDYSLVPNSPGSSANPFLQKNERFGKLTLKSIRHLGRNNEVNIPDETYEYGYNPEYKQYRTSAWGTYSDMTNVVNPTSFPSGSNYPQVKEVADQSAAAYSLNKINTVLGSEINIEYESDTFKYVSDKIYDNDYRIQLDEQQLNTLDYTGKYSSTIDGILGSSSLSDFDIGIEITIYDGPTPRPLRSYTTLSENGGAIVAFNAANSTVTVDRNLEHSTATEKRKYFLIDKRGYDIFGGGHRVRSISLNDKANSQQFTKNIFTYYDGATPSLPYGFATGLSYEDLRGEPGVGYNRVEIYQVSDNDNQALMGKNVEQYFTSKDFPIQVDRKESTTVGTYNFSINDYSAIVGMMKESSVYGTKKNTLGENPDDFYLISKSKNLYAFGDSLGQHVINGDISDLNDIYIANKNPIRSVVSSDSINRNIGIHQLSYQSMNEDALQGNRNPLRVNLNKFSLYPIGSKATQMFYDHDQVNIGEISTKSYIIGLDGKTGDAILTMNYDSELNRYVNESIPAYWVYPELEAKNMLNQAAVNSSYKILSQESGDVLDVYHKTTTNSNVLGLNTSVTRWADFDGIHRVKDRYVWSRQNDLDNTFDYWNTMINDHNYLQSQRDPSKTENWVRTSNITEYNRFGKVVESKDIQNIHTYTVYGYDGSLPIATITNVLTSQQNGHRIVFKNFEEENSVNPDPYRNEDDPDRIHAKTGRYVGAVSELDIRTPSVSGQYHLSYWYYSNSEWKLFEDKSLSANQNLTRPSGVEIEFIDDLRIHPAGSFMATNTYDYKTWKLTSATDINHMSIYYEYDNAGRLKVVRDDERNIKTYYKTNYAQFGGE